MKLKELLELVDDRHLDIIICDTETKAPIFTINNSSVCSVLKHLGDAEVIEIFDVSIVSCCPKNGAISIIVDLPVVIFE